MYLNLFTGILFFLLVQQCQSLKILMYQIAFSNTHMPFAGAIADTLIDRGHIVDEIIMAYHNNVKSNGSNHIRNVYRIELEENAFMKSDHLVDPFKMTHFNRHDPKGIETRYEFCKKLMEDETLINKLQQEKFDVFLIGPFDYCALGLNQILRISSVSVFSVLAQDGFISIKLGTPALPSYVPQVFDGYVYGRDRSFMERLRSFLYLADFEYDELGMGVEEVRYLRTKIPNFPSITELLKTISYVFLNTNELIDISQPVTARTKYLGGIAMPQNNGKLSTEIEKILSVNNNGAILFSFGSLIQTNSIPLDKKFEILRAFKQFPNYSFLWKLHEEDEIRTYVGNYSNVYPIDWLPQIPLLNDNRVKLFISHMGQNSYLETSFAGKPVIGIPFFVDQFYNMDCALHNEVGIYLDKQNITTESMVNALNRVLSNPKYARNAKELASMLEDRTQNARDELIKGIEYSAKHPRLNEFLQLEAADLPTWKLYCVDIVVFLFLSALLSIVLSFYVLKLFVRMILKKKSKSKKD